MKKLELENSESFARKMDEQDPLQKFHDQFLFPETLSGTTCIYLCGNSLGLQPKKTKEYINQELEDWAHLGVKAHFHAKHPWMPYHENLTKLLARLVGAKPIEVVAMNTLTVNLHLMMVSFYRPTSKRFKILIESGAFPSDQYAVASQARFHGYDPKQAIVELVPRPGQITLKTEDILSQIKKEGDSIALVLLGNVNYLTGQAFEMEAITHTAHTKGCIVGFDLAHGAGNLELKLHDWDVDFAAWCSYKYLNAGPGSLAGCFVHERHAQNPKLPRFEGWWGNQKNTRFQMKSVFDPTPGAEGWQLSNPPIFPLAALRASLEIFDEATMTALQKKSALLTGFLEFLLQQSASQYCTILSPSDPRQRGCQLSLKFKMTNGKTLLQKLHHKGVFCDWREPDILRVAPAPLYNRFQDVFHFMQALNASMEEKGGVV